MKKFKNKIRYGLIIIGLSFTISMILGVISCNIHGVITASYFYIAYPIVLGLLTLIVFLITRIFNKDLALIIAVILSIINISWNILQFVLVLR